MYAIVRGDLSPGKAASQAGHAFLDTYLRAPLEITQTYLADGGGTKIVLAARNGALLRCALNEAERRGFPCALVEEDGEALALGIGPISRDAAKAITNRFSLMK